MARVSRCRRRSFKMSLRLRLCLPSDLGLPRRTEFLVSVGGRPHHRDISRPPPSFLFHSQAAVGGTGVAPLRPLLNQVRSSLC
ncbi:unnamed protein product [Microthlaspi erraticum]|uniref:Uncharacterized protein n=1 Tax=Microthlaspi erraticum TaxID=1685480 RepID=A0A6D2L6A6_9BRAS|nr:unnamed protein product [Microthlaspi erraticum]